MIRSALPSAPPDWSWTAKVPSYPMYLNDRLGDCAIASPAHMLQTWSANATKEIRVTDNDVLKGYMDVSGYNGSPQSDVGCNMTDVNNYLVQTGIGGHRIAAWAKIANHDLELMRTAGWLFGGLSLGVQLPAAWKGQRIWTAPPTRPFGQWSPGSWGGHAVPAEACNSTASSLIVVTWGDVLPISWAALPIYADEVYVYFSLDWFDGTRQAPSGIDMDALASDFESATGRPVVIPARPVPPPVPPTPIPGGIPMSFFQIMQWLVQFAQSPQGQGIITMLHDLYLWIVSQQPKSEADMQSLVSQYKNMKGLP